MPNSATPEAPDPLLLSGERLAEILDDTVEIGCHFGAEATLTPEMCGIAYNDLADLLAHCDAQQAAFDAYREQVAMELRSLCPPSAERLAAYDSPIVKEMSALYRTLIRAAATNLGLSL